MKLKTLKDMNWDADDGDTCLHIDMGYGDGCGFFPEKVNETLRQEAIKWIEEMKEDIPEGKTPQQVKDIINGMNGAINWIKHFFNISDKEVEHN